MRCCCVCWHSTYTLMKCIANSSESFISKSKRISWGSCNRARVKSANIAGNVAEKRQVCRASGTEDSIASSCDWKPISNSRSASSQTTYSTRCKDNWASNNTCCKRPGVPTTTSGLRANVSNCSSTASPPTRSAKRNGGSTK